jgi:hypothetical protein
MNVPHGKAQVNAVYGVPYTPDLKLNKTWYSANVVTMKLPFPMRVAWDPGTTIRSIVVHKLVAPHLEAALTDVYTAARYMVKQKYGFDKTSQWYDQMTLKFLQVLGLDLYGGCFNFRLKRGGSSLSTHSWGIAIDIDPAHNGLGNSKYTIPSWVVKIFEKRGFFWGGRWSGRNVDAMHFQLATGI